MNKKRLSVVMAGAMLASSVAPVLAAETTEVAKSEHSAADLGLLIGKIRTKLTSATFAADTVEDMRINGTKAGKSIYFVAVDGVKVALDESSSQADYQRVLGNLKVGQKVSIWSYANTKDAAGKYYVKKKEDKKFTEKTLEDAAIAILGGSTGSVGNTVQTNYDAIIDSAVYDADTDMLKIDFKEGVNDNKVSDLVLTIGTTEYDVKNYLNASGKEVVVATTKPAVATFFGFPTVSDFSTEGLKNEELEIITITPGGYSLTVEDLYDGLFLTKKGEEFFGKIAARLAAIDTTDGTKDVVEIKCGTTPIAGLNKNTITALDANPTVYDTNVSQIFKKDGKFTITVRIKAQSPNKADEVYTITGTNEANIKRLVQWMMKPQARVDVLSGDNRYETAVEIAKEYAGLKGPGAADNTETIKNIVLVNGNALVDGLAAAPLVSSIETKVGGGAKVPMLLTEADHLPKATRAYLKELMADHLVGANKTAKIHLVGGEAVLNKSLERELKALGFEVVRYAGDNREETSLKVLEAIGSTNKVFVVGAEGEADAMSIASVAAEYTLPIVVAKKGGITEDALYELKGKNVTVIGGEGVLSAADYKAIKAEAKSIERVYGSNRKETNAEIIAKYYKDSYVGAAKNVMVAKDGQNNKSELVDALAAANLAAQKDAPIVLATDKLASSQINALELNAKGAFGLYQIGNGVARNVVKTIAENLGLSNR